MNSNRAEKTTTGTELLAPAGSVEALRAAFQAGADAVYIGGDRFGARAYADNPGEEELLAAIDLAHRLGKRLYMTVNTLLKDQELETELYRWMRPYVEEGLDGVIIQDFGAVRLFQHMFPELPLHASTQMTVTGLHGAEFLKRQGFVRVVPARELSLAEICRIREKTGLEVETFIHGAMCYAYSGQCLFSSMLGGRSGNRGRCAGICRLPFEVYRADGCFRQGEKLENPLLERAGKKRGGRQREDHREYYPLNMKDMCTVEILPDLVQAGISSLKIEGRMKKPEYTAGVVSVYRKYLDRWKENPDPASWRVEEADKKFLWDLFNRDGFNRSYYYEKNGRDMIALNNEKLDHVRQQAAQKLTDQIRSRLSEPDVQLRLQAPVSGTLDIQEGSARLELTLLLPGEAETGSPIRVSLEREGVQKAKNQPVTEKRVRKQMQKTGTSLFRFSSLKIRMEDNLFLPMQLLNELRRDGFSMLDQACRERYRRKTAALSPSFENGGKPELFVPEKRDTGHRDALPIWASVEQNEQLKVLSEKEGLTGIYLPAALFSSKDRAAEFLSRMGMHGIRAGLALPPVLRERNEAMCRRAVSAYLDSLGEQMPRILLRGLEEAGLVAELFRATGRDLSSGTILDSGVWTMNTEAERWFADCGYRYNTVSPELNRKELLLRDNTESELVVYGRTPLMLAQQCLQQTMDRCDRGSQRFFLKDRKNILFPVQCDCSSCTNIIYNSLPTSLLGLRQEVDPLACASLRLCFTTEDGRETGRLADAFLLEYGTGEKYGGESLEQGQFTRGHFHRGVL